MPKSPAAPQMDSCRDYPAVASLGSGPGSECTAVVRSAGNRQIDVGTTPQSGEEGCRAAGTQSCLGLGDRELRKANGRVVGGYG